MKHFNYSEFLQCGLPREVYDLEQEETQMSSRGLFGIKGPKRITNQKEIAQILKKSKRKQETKRNRQNA